MTTREKVEVTSAIVALLAIWLGIIIGFGRWVGYDVVAYVLLSLVAGLVLSGITYSLMRSIKETR